MKARLSAILALIAMLALFAGALAPVAVVSTFAQAPVPSTPDLRRFPLPPGEPRLNAPGDPYQTANGLWAMPGGVDSGAGSSIASPQATGGPDDFGYTWNDSVPFSWVDATAGGIDTGMSGSALNQAVGPIALPFSFKFYENTYTQVYIAAAGYLSFSPNSYWPHQQNPMPSVQPPNDVIAPFWTVTYVQSSGLAGRVYYASGGTAPNRYFVVEWFDVKGGTPSDPSGGDETYRFEVILYENGDIVTQYHTMVYNNWRYYASIGIEDSTGSDGLGYMDWNNYWSRLPSSNKAVRFYRPAPSARVQVSPLYHGQFARAGETIAFQVSIRNIGELGADTYDLFVSSGWPVSLYAADGITPLTDTDTDTFIDTGPVNQNATTVVTVKVDAPGGAVVGDDNTVDLTVTSSLNTGKSKPAHLQATIPTSFVQVFRDDTNSAMSLYLVQPAGQSLERVTGDDYYGYDMAVAEGAGSDFVYAWRKFRSLGSVYTYEIEYSLVNRYGEVVRDVSKLTNNSGAAVSTYDSVPAVAAASNGRIGILWYRHLYNSGNSQSNFNIYFAILDASGNVVYGPANLTNNSAWGAGSTLNVPSFYYPRIAATGDNRFVLTWLREHQESTGYVDDIYTSVRDSNGGQVQAITRFTFDTPGWSEAYYYPNLASLSGNRALLTWYRYSDGDVYYAVLNSSGGTFKVATNLVGDGSSQYDWGPDAAQLSDGKVVVAWTGGIYPNYRIRFAVLDASYNRIAGPTTLNNPAAITGDSYVSVAADAAGRAILTWMAYFYDNRRNLYYALVDGNGSQVTPPMIFLSSQGSSTNMETGPGGGGPSPDIIETSYEGYGNTSYSWTPPAGVDGVASFGGALFGGAPGGVATISVRYANHGASLATSTVLTATLDSSLTYQSDTSGIVPTVSGNSVAWNLPDIELLEEGQFTLRVNLPVAAIGTRYPITLTLASAGSEANPADNTASAEVMVARQVFLPVVSRNYP